MEEKLEEKLKEERQNREREIEKMKAQFIELMKEAIKGSQEASTVNNRVLKLLVLQFDQQYDPNTQPISRSRLSSSGGSNNDRPGPSSKLDEVPPISRSQSLDSLHSDDSVTKIGGSSQFR
ncbi:hypothetical protein TNCT_445011 [Trichonephila clavata]|uniref:Uncharacterized protein n=1 Tax=Trichonephila clavata TaxID=2740835 RepID=A0A8X6J7H7_TRICU|nr:hypothetical protein TNCT_445011 [Trichonephila clavata]